MVSLERMIKNCGISFLSMCLGFCADAYKRMDWGAGAIKKSRSQATVREADLESGGGLPEPGLNVELPQADN
jgi:hypothetical protein